MRLQFTPKHTCRRESTTSPGQASVPHVRMKLPRDKALQDSPQCAPRSEENTTFCSCWLSRTIMGPGICVKLFLPATDPKRETSCLLRGAGPAPPLGRERFQSTFPDTALAGPCRVTVHPGRHGQPGSLEQQQPAHWGNSAAPQAAAAVHAPSLCSHTHESSCRPGTVGTTSPICCHRRPCFRTRGWRQLARKAPSVSPG